MSLPSRAFVVGSTDDVPVAVHELAAGHDRPPLLVSHATGFCAHAYQPIATALSGFRCLGLDHRGHGSTPAPPGWETGRGVDWARFGDDTLAVARALSAPGEVVGFGHSMGASSLLMAAHHDPSVFRLLVLFEPIARPPEAAPSNIYWWPIVEGARRRRRWFESYEQAFANFHGKPPLSVMTPEALFGYVHHGLRPKAEGGVELCCAPELEASIFVEGPLNGVWELLPEIATPVVVVTGVVEPDQPSHWAEPIASRLPHGELVELPHHTHLGPFSHPDEVAALISARA